MAVNEQSVLTGSDCLPSWAGANSYTDTFIIPPFSLRTSTDVLVVHLTKPCHRNLINILDSLCFNTISDQEPKKGGYRRIQKLDHPILKTSIHILYRKKPYCSNIPSVQVRIHDPNKASIALLDHVFALLESEFTLSMVELTFDFYTGHIQELRHFIEEHLFLKHQRQASFKLKNTWYSTNLRKASKGTRLYEKEIDGEKVLRLELVLKRQVLRRAGIDWPLDRIDDLDVSRYFDFRKVEVDMVASYLVKKANKMKKRMLEGRSNGQPNEFRSISPRSGMILRQIIPQKPYPTLMEIVDNIKRLDISNYSRFITALDDFNRIFFTMVERRGFLPDTGVMGRIELPWFKGIKA